MAGWLFSELLERSQTQHTSNTHLHPRLYKLSYAKFAQLQTDAL